MARKGYKTRRPEPLIVASAFALTMNGASLGAASASPTVYPTGVTIYDHTAAYDCAVLFAASDHKTYLIDMEGHVVKRWDKGGEPAKMVDPALYGGRKGVVGLQLAATSVIGAKEGDGVALVPGAARATQDETFGFVDWSGKVLWEWGKQAPGGAALQNHDWDLLANGDVLILSYIVHSIPGFGDHPKVDDVIYEVDRGGKIVWRWLASEHLAEFGFTPDQLKLVQHGPAPDFLHVNDMEVLGSNHWVKGGDARFATDNIMISSRNANFTVIIDRKTGKIVWRIGPDYPPRDEFKPGIVPRPIDQISGQHDPHMIPEGLPGAGNILMFDNQGEAGYPPVALEITGGSRVLEIDPVTKQIVWEYTAGHSGHADWTFFSPFIGSVQRLPNGNTLIDEGINGRFFQVTTAGKIVWEYVSPFFGPSPPPQLPGHAPAMSNWAYRAQCVPAAWLPRTDFLK